MIEPLPFETLTKTRAAQIIGGLSNPSKMPGFGFSIPAIHCRAGSKLRTVPGTVCFKCYALKGRYTFRTVRAAMERRFQILTRTLESGRGSEPWILWCRAFETLVTGSEYFRFHDSGDLQSVAHLLLYCDAARLVPDTRVWIPTKESGIIRRTNPDEIPDNVLIRLSAARVDAMPNPLTWSHGSTVLSRATLAAGTPAGVRVCPSRDNGNRCGDCRACWDPAVPIVAYPLH